jgi:hypothetical protein
MLLDQIPQKFRTELLAQRRKYFWHILEEFKHYVIYRIAGVTIALHTLNQARSVSTAI